MLSFCLDDSVLRSTRVLRVCRVGTRRQEKRKNMADFAVVFGRDNSMSACQIDFWSHPGKHMLASFPSFRFMLDGVSEHPRHQIILFEATERHSVLGCNFWRTRPGADIAWFPCHFWRLRTRECDRNEKVLGRKNRFYIQLRGAPMKLKYL